ncbi:hypothetical protein SAMN04487977_11052 [Treponema bryantii]|uniref:Uncharacterized protein n=1 Tax=Treponema bryantii TaxID=163 RepID=A0A1H9INM5_9SPIR|nr:hypothetical protein [Treponema bryantii]SEQ76351.1 hypothetical protein SAMN04487977_11052 [Treponema bryantii]
MNAQILIKTANDWFEFTKSKTGQLDYVGKWEQNNKPDVDGAKKLASSTYYTPSFFTFIDSALNCNPVVYVAPDADVSDKDVFDYLIHIGALLAAVEAKNSLLAGELYLRRRTVFEKFAQLTQYILEPYCVEILFSLCYGCMANIDPDTVPLLFESVKEKLDFDSSRETLDQAYMRWFKKNNVTLTLPLVGTCFYNWDAEPYVLDKLCDNLNCDDLLGMAEKIRNAKHNFYESLETVVQAEPYNSHDKNSILVCIESPEAKIAGNPGLEKAGHIRALAAKIIRESKPKMMAYPSKLAYVGGEEIVVSVKL